LRNPPFNFDIHTAYITAAKIFFQGSGNVGLWHACANPVTDGCGADSGYMNWLAADDDNGDLTDGTPHMTALYNAFNRHGIACSTPTPQNSGCAGAPTESAALFPVPDNNAVYLFWTEVPNAVRYWVFRMEGHVPEEYGKTLIGIVDGKTTFYADLEVANGRSYCYVVMAVGANNACFAPASAAACASLPPG
jgi:hypothetical protein